MNDLVGTVLGRFQLVEYLGGSRQGEVYRGLQQDLDREVAVRVLLPEQARDGRVLSRFRQESRTTAQLSHPHVLTVYDSGKKDDLRFLVMELLDPETLAARLTRLQTLPLEEALRVAEEVTRALEYMHSRKLLHGMVVPSNVRFDLRGNTILTGIGTEAPDRLPRIQELGAQGFGSPEILLGEKVSPSSDLYQVGVLLYACLCGRPPYAGRPPFVVGGSGFEERIPRPRSLRKEISRDLENLVLRCLRTAPGERHSDASALLSDLSKARRRVQVRQVSRNVASRSAAPVSESSAAPRPLQGVSSTPPRAAPRPWTVTALEMLTGGHGDLNQRETRIRLALLATPVLLTVLVAGMVAGGFFRGQDLRVLEAMHEAEEKQVAVSWKSNRPCYGYLEFHQDGSPVGQTRPSQASQTVFRQTMEGLEGGKTYEYVICLSSSPEGAVDRSATRSVKTRDPLGVSEVQVTDREEREVTLSWRTNRPSDTRIRYWQGTRPPIEVENPEFERDRTHRLTLRGLLPGTTYQYQILAREPGGSREGFTSAVERFTTRAGSREVSDRRAAVEAALTKLRGLDRSELSKLEASLGDLTGGSGELTTEQRALLAMTRTEDASGFFRRRSLAARWAEQRAAVKARQPDIPEWSPRSDFPATLAYLKDYYAATQDPGRAHQRLDECIRALAEIEGLPVQ